MSARGVDPVAQVGALSRLSGDTVAQETLARFTALAGNLPLGLLMENAERRVLHVNAAFCEMFGVPSPTLLLGNDCAADAECSKHLFADPESFLTRVAELLNAGRPSRNEELLLADGRVLLRDYAPVRAADGALLGHLWLYLDITDNKRTERELAQSQRELESIFENLQDTYYRTDQAGRILRVSPSVQRLFGYEPAELIGTPLEDYYCESAGRRSFLAALAAAGSHLQGFEVAMRHRAGHTVWVAASSSYWYDGSGAIGGVEGIVRDITERRESARQLAESEARYSSVVNHIREVVFQTDAAGLWTFLNPAWAEITGFAVADSLGRCFLDYIHPDDRERNARLFQPLIERRKDYCHHQIRYLTCDGGFRWIEVHARLTLDAGDAIIGTSGTLRDVTEQRRAEELQRFGAFQAGIAEMNTSVLHNIGNAITTLGNDAVLLGQACADLDRIAALLRQHAAHTAAALPEEPRVERSVVDGLLGLQCEVATVLERLCRDTLRERSQRIGASAQHITDIVRIQQSASLPGSQVSTFSLRQAVEDALALQGEFFERCRIQVTVRIDPAADEVTLSRNRLLQALINLFRNSGEAISERQHQEQCPGGHLEVCAEALAEDRVRLTVTDNGIGVEAAYLPEVFRFGFSTKARGSGFGLHAVALFVQEAGGHIALQSAGRGQGAALLLELPRRLTVAPGPVAGATLNIPLHF